MSIYRHFRCTDCRDEFMTFDVTPHEATDCNKCGALIKTRYRCKIHADNWLSKNDVSFSLRCRECRGPLDSLSFPDGTLLVWDEEEV